MTDEHDYLPGDRAEEALEFARGVLGAAGREITDPAALAALEDYAYGRISGAEYRKRLGISPRSDGTP